MSPTSRKLPPLSRRERQIMEVLHSRSGPGGAGPTSVAEVLAGIPDPPSYSAVRALLAILERKGHVRHKSISNRYLYEPTTSTKVAAKSALRRMLETFFAGSIERALATHLADPSTRLSPEELQRLTKLIEEAQQREKT